MRHRHQHAGHVLPAAQGVEVGGHRVRGDIHRDHNAVHVLFSKVAVEVIWRFHLGDRMTNHGDNLGSSTDHFEPHLLNECCESISVEAGSDNAEFGHVGC